jgi:hypothetical protein
MGKERTLRAPTGAILSKYLRALALDMETVNDDGDPVTKAAALAKFVWQAALGYRSVDPKNGSVIVHEPDWRAIELLYNRIEGRIAIAPPEEVGHSLIEKVTEMGRARANSLAAAATEAEANGDPVEEEEDA